MDVIRSFEIEGLEGLTFKFEGKIHRAVNSKTKNLISTITQGQNTYCRFRVDNPENPDDDDYLPAKQGIYLLVVMPELRPVLALYRAGKTKGNGFQLTADAVSAGGTLRAQSNHNSGYNDVNATVYKKSNGLENLYLYIAEVTYRKREDGDSKAKEINAIADVDGTLKIIGDRQDQGIGKPKPKDPTEPNPPAPPEPEGPDFVDTPKARDKKFPRNLIYFGAPGTGKSYDLDYDKDALLGEGNEGQYERVTFHPAYTYANFVGTYKPKMVPVKDKDGKIVPGEKAITYEYVAGPFLDVYVKAKKDPKKPYMLIIEEINRAEVAAVFGEVFQLLDRNMKDCKGASTYSIQASEDEKEYLEGKGVKDPERISIPGNMYIWATMNSADQGVKPMDTAFKRRWDFKYKSVDDKDTEKDIRNLKVLLPAKDSNGKPVKKFVNWNMLRKAINRWMSNNSINEDKQLGPYFLSANVLTPEDNDKDPDVMNSETFIEAFKSKIIMYLFEDAAKSKRPTLFSGCNEDKNKGGKGNDMTRRYSDICTKFDEIGVYIFYKDIVNYTEGSKTIFVEGDATQENEQENPAPADEPAEDTPVEGEGGAPAADEGNSEPPEGPAPEDNGPEEQ